MPISAKTEYACLALVDLALAHATGEPLQARRIANAHGIPSGFLVQILLQLKGAGLVTSTRGASGGYRLARDPAEISLWEVMTVIEGNPNDWTPSASLSTPAGDVLAATWNQAAELQRDMLCSTSLEDLAEQVRAQSADMYYI